MPIDSTKIALWQAGVNIPGKWYRETLLVACYFLKTLEYLSIFNDRTVVRIEREISERQEKLKELDHKTVVWILQCYKFKNIISDYLNKPFYEKQ